MAVTIDKDLLEFNNKMASATGNISSVINNLSSKLDEVNSGASAAASGLSSVYQGTGLSMVQSAFSSISSAVEGIKASFESGPKKAVSLAEDLVSEIKKLIELKNEIDELEGKTTETDAKTEDEQSASDESKEQLTAKEQEFKTKHESCKAKLSELKGLNPTIDISVKAATPINSGTGEVRAELQNLQEGKPNKVVYTGKNGRTITAYVYLPNGASSIEGLPITLHMGGDASKADGVHQGGLGAGVGNDISGGQQYSGIVVVLEAEDDHSYYDQKYLATAKELADNLVTTYNADSNRISVSGYSYGSYGACNMMSMYPSYFSSSAILAGGNGTGGGKTKTLVIIGTRDPIYKEVEANYSGRQNQNIIFYPVNDDHGVNSYAHSSFVVNGVEYKNYIEYCLAQTKNS